VHVLHAVDPSQPRLVCDVAGRTIASAEGNASRIPYKSPSQISRNTLLNWRLAESCLSVEPKPKPHVTRSGERNTVKKMLGLLIPLVVGKTWCPEEERAKSTETLAKSTAKLIEFGPLCITFVALRRCCRVRWAKPTCETAARRAGSAVPMLDHGTTLPRISTAEAFCEEMVRQLAGLKVRKAGPSANLQIKVDCHLERLRIYSQLSETLGHAVGPRSPRRVRLCLT